MEIFADAEQIRFIIRMIKMHVHVHPVSDIISYIAFASGESQHNSLQQIKGH